MGIGLRIKELRKGLGFNQIQFSAKLGVDNGQYSKIEAEKLQPTVALIIEICSIFEVNSNWLLTGKGKIYKNSIEIDELKSLAVSEPPTDFYAEKKIRTKEIPLLPLDAFAGNADSSANGVSFHDVQDNYIVPLFDGVKIDFMLSVRGSSMYPKYSSGDVVACRVVEELLFIQWNKVYVIDTISQGVLMKRLKKSDTETDIICKSDNKDYDEFLLPKEDIRKIALVVGVIRLE